MAWKSKLQSTVAVSRGGWTYHPGADLDQGGVKWDANSLGWSNNTEYEYQERNGEGVYGGLALAEEADTETVYSVGKNPASGYFTESKKINQFLLYI